MPDINMQVFEEAKRNQLITEVDIQTQVALDDYQVQLSDIANPTQSQDNVVIDRFGEFLPHWNESLDFDTWVKMSMEVTGKQLLILRGNSSVSSASSGNNTFIQYNGSTASQYLKALNLLVTNIIGEWKLKWTNPIALQPTLTNLIGTTDDFYYVYYNNGAGYGSIGGAANEGTASHTAWDTNIIAENTYHKFKIEAGASSAEYFTNGVSLGIVSTNLPDENLGLGVRVVSGSYEQEWAFVRKYTSTEPIWAADGAEQNMAVTLKSLGRAG